MAPEHKPDLDQPDERKAAAKTAKALKRDFSSIKTAADAERALDRLERTDSRLEGEMPKRERKPQAQAEAIDRVRHETSLAAVEATAREVATSDRENQPVIDRAITVAGEGSNEETSSRQGRSLLRKELLKRLRPLDAVDTILFVRVNSLPHPKWSDRIFSRLSWLFTGGHGWLLVLAMFSLTGRGRALRVARETMPAIWLATYLVEGPIKRFFRRKRPFISIVRAVVVGRKPGSYSFPSGHSAAAFSGAVLLSRKYPQYSGRLFLLAGLIGFSRIFLGAHYPGDVLSGGFAGASLASLFHKMTKRLLAPRAKR